MEMSVVQMNHLSRPHTHPPSCLHDPTTAIHGWVCSVGYGRFQRHSPTVDKLNVCSVHTSQKILGRQGDPLLLKTTNHTRGRALMQRHFLLLHVQPSVLPCLPQHPWDHARFLPGPAFEDLLSQEPKMKSSGIPPPLPVPLPPPPPFSLSPPSLFKHSSFISFMALLSSSSVLPFLTVGPRLSWNSWAPVILWLWFPKQWAGGLCPTTPSLGCCLSKCHQDHLIKLAPRGLPYSILACFY